MAPQREMPPAAQWEDRERALRFLVGAMLPYQQASLGLAALASGDREQVRFRV
jgi:hypothetical protein